MEESEEKDLLTGLIYGVLHEQDPVSGADFAARIAVCARLAHGDQEVYGRAVKKAVVSEGNLTELFGRQETEDVIREFLRAIRRARNNAETLRWMAEQFAEPQSNVVMKDYLVAVERSLANNFIVKAQP